MVSLACSIESAINEKLCLEQKNSAKIYNSSRLPEQCKNCSSVLIGLTTVNSVVTRLLDEWVGKCIIMPR